MSEGTRLQIFRFFGGWVWGEGKKKKKQAQADCVRPSRAPTSNNYAQCPSPLQIFVLFTKGAHNHHNFFQL